MTILMGSINFVMIWRKKQAAKMNGVKAFINLDFMHN